MAADLMLKMLSARTVSVPRTICCGTVKRVVERESTKPPAPAAFLIERALKFIAENAVKGVGPREVAAHLGVSRTLLDLRFREMGTGTVGELIMERRLAVLSAMLRKSKLPIGRLAEECGFGNAKYAKAVFKKRFGMTMREWRISYTKR
jgi:LacI family transcriptional regulator